MICKKNIRLKEYDYSTNGYYFVTICTNYRKKMFEPKISDKYDYNFSKNVAAGLPIYDVVAGSPCQKESKKNTDIIEENILDTEKRFSIDIDFHCIMPDHVHLIIAMKNNGEDTSPLQKVTLGQIVAYFKYQTTRKVNETKNKIKQKLWQPNYFEHIIRNEKALGKIREYIKNNPGEEVNSFDKFYGTV
ncbi:MAG: hypothetical protein A2474_07995 [Elusimicrobia bacterium RIFOXYC2_FULL_34_12]|nr:MAG: hypothetical protein A2474_07995 [Elusimicrobia bacterium RIFOXYC2_FULL_34_12]OGS38218.1 MAG: hypothetical protein A2551_03255 [Elusimicrobia bacterium RIFOXYD2_FULL_34_30]HAM38174.1 hypothetical protein [Elusimicrobiota bacterium]